MMCVVCVVVVMIMVIVMVVFVCMVMVVIMFVMVVVVEQLYVCEVYGKFQYCNWNCFVEVNWYWCQQVCDCFIVDQYCDYCQYDCVCEIGEVVEFVGVEYEMWIVGMLVCIGIGQCGDQYCVCMC